MATQTKRTQQGSTDDANETVAGLAGAAGTLAEIHRQQLAASADVLCSMFRAAEALQQVQLQMGQRAALLHSQAADNIRKATSPTELVSVQSTLVMYEFQEAMRYTQELVTALARSGGEMLRPVQAAQGGNAASTSPATTMMGAAMSAAGPMADAFQQMFTAPMKAAAQSSQSTH
ncbi:hypothetical protein EZ313_08785 [Ramlibacter henchirensis]|uniref:Phasin domain-containing protein n=1 Tax=Ramlibacter henchirensis TaxID=204072 RepID=A0A4Z0C601_9BURK|nr:phasin family protein [Ramlibacter henchirensis]TFZ06701.1 hypothetical protein EZ313_08785 [Ramlibacter henchirensis]